MSVPQIRIAAIEAIARKILMEYAPALLEGEPCAIPIETIIETKFDLILEYHILRKNGSILGETIFDDGAVILYDQYQHEYSETEQCTPMQYYSDPSNYRVTLKCISNKEAENWREQLKKIKYIIM